MASFDSISTPLIATPNRQRFGQSPERVSSFPSPFDVAKHELHVNANTHPAAIQHPFGPHAVCANPLWSRDGIHNGWHPSLAAYNTLYPFVKEDQSGLRQAGCAANEPRRLLIDFDNAKPQRLSSQRHQSLHDCREHDTPRSIGSSSPTFLEYFESDRFKRSCLSRMDDAWATNVHLLSKWRPLLQTSPSSSQSEQQHLAEVSSPSMPESKMSSKEGVQSAINSDVGTFKQNSPKGSTQPEQIPISTPGQARIPKLALPPPPSNCQEAHEEAEDVSSSSSSSDAESKKKCNNKKKEQKHKKDKKEGHRDGPKKEKSSTDCKGAMMGSTVVQVDDWSKFRQEGLRSSPPSSCQEEFFQSTPSGSHATVNSALIDGKVNDKSDVSKVSMTPPGSRQLPSHVSVNSDLFEGRANDMSNASRVSFAKRVVSDCVEDTRQAHFHAHTHPNVPNSELDQLEELETCSVAPQKAKIKQSEKRERAKATKSKTLREREEGHQGMHSEEMEMRLQALEEYVVDLQSTKTQSSQELQERSNELWKVETVLRKCEAECLQVKHAEANLASRLNFSQRAKTKIKGRTGNATASLIAEVEEAREKERHALEHAAEADARVASSHRVNNQLRQRIQKLEVEHREASDEHAATNHVQRQRHLTDLGLAERDLLKSEEAESNLEDEIAELRSTMSEEARSHLLREEYRLNASRGNMHEEAKLAFNRANEVEKKLKLSAQQLAALKARDDASRSEVKSAEEKLIARDETLRSEIKSVEQEHNAWKEEAGKCEIRERQANQKLHMLQPRFDDTRKELDGARHEVANVSASLRAALDELRQESESFEEEKMIFREEAAKCEEKERVHTQNFTNLQARLRATASNHADAINENERLKEFIAQSEHQMNAKLHPYPGSERPRLLSSPRSSSPRSMLNSSPQSSSPRSRTRSSLQSTRVDMIGFSTEVPKRRSRRSGDTLGDDSFAGDSAGEGRPIGIQASANSKAEAAAEAAALIQESLLAASQFEGRGKHERKRAASILKPSNNGSSLGSPEDTRNVYFNPLVSETSAG